MVTKWETGENRQPRKEIKNWKYRGPVQNLKGKSFQPKKPEKSANSVRKLLQVNNLQKVPFEFCFHYYM
jgi:hypothetical protein